MKINKRLFIIFIFAFLIRLISFDQSLWQDEATTAMVVQNYNYSHIISQFSPGDFHPPFYYLVMKFWTNIFGYSEIALRMPSVIFSLAAGWFVYLIAGVWGAIFFLFNPLIVYFSQEARMYMMATMFLTGGIYYFLESQKSKVKSQKDNSKLKNLILMNIFFTAAFFSFYGSVFMIAAVFIFYLLKKNYKVFIFNSLYFILIVLLISPLLVKQLINARISFPEVSNWSLVLGNANIKNLALIPVKFSIGRIDFFPKWLYYLIAGGWTALVFYKISKIKNISLFNYLFIFPLALGFIISFFTPLLQYFRFLYLIPIMAILLSKIKASKCRYVLISGFLVFSFVYLLISQFHREDWKGLVRSLPTGKSVYMIPSSADAVRYYNKNIVINDLITLPDNMLESEIVVIPFNTGVYGLDYKTRLEEKKYSLKDKKTFRELELEIWIKY